MIGPVIYEPSHLVDNCLLHIVDTWRDLTDIRYYMGDNKGSAISLPRTPLVGGGRGALHQRNGPNKI